VNVSEQAHRAYAPTQIPIHTPRSIEAKLLSQVTAALQKATEDDASFNDLVAAIHRNRELWILLASDVADPDNGLPELLRAQIFYLSEFTEKHSQSVLRGDADTKPLIEINTAVLRGLNAQEAS